MFTFLNNKKISRAISSLMVFVLLFNNLIFPTRAFALTSGPSQPEFSSFDSVNASEMVNMFTGDFSYNIPLMDVDGYPINISYHASPGMDQEASWVGLGWNINSGAINRSMRGLPDDFNGEEIKREINIKDFKSWGVGVGGGAEIAGLDASVAWNLSAGLGVTKSNYKGIGIEYYFEPTLSTAAGNKFQGNLTAGLGIKASTTDGVNIYPQLGISGQSKTSNATTSIGYNVGATYNSRAGAMAVNNGITISASRGKYKGHNKRNGQNGIGLGTGSSVNIPTSSQGFLPQITSNMKSQSYSLDFKLGSNNCLVAPFKYIRGYYAQNGLASSDISLNGYGYLNSQNGDRNALHDFSREKDGMMYAETPNLPITNFSYDMFGASAHGMEMAFRPHRNDIGMLHDNPTIETSFGIGASAEIMVTPDVNVGTNVNTHWSDGKSGKWEANNDMAVNAAFSIPNTNYEAAYFKVAGEKTADDAGFIANVMGESAVKVQLSSITNQDWKATSIINNNAMSAQTIIGTKSKRATRNNLVSFLSAEEAQFGAIDKTIRYYPMINSSSLDGPDGLVNKNDQTQYYGEIKSNLTGDYNRLSYAGNKKDHISEITITNTNGGRYVYGIPVYNKGQNEVMFNISAPAGSNGSSQTNSSFSSGLISYGPNVDDSKNNTKGIDNFYEKNIIPAYAHSYLLTEILSTDYVDRTGNGPSQDDYGDYTKFNYTNYGDANWRIPFEQNKALFNQGFLSDKTDDKASYLYGTKNLWFPQSIETKNFIAFFIFETGGIRKDGYFTSSSAGGRNNASAQPRLYEIRLYAKKDFGPNMMRNALGQQNVPPIKVVHFEYDFSLCPGVPNNIETTTPGTAVIETAPGPSYGLPKNGKLTLKKIYFTYGNSKKGNLNPYSFTYCNGNYNNPAYNPTYNPASIDRWGYYQQNIADEANNNLDFPYTRQNKAQADLNAAVWSLTEIKTPAGSKLSVTYEADDYGYVQNKEATQMYKTLGISNSTAGPIGSVLYDKDYLFVDLSVHGTNGVALNTPNAPDVIKDKFLKDLTKIYIKACVELAPGKSEFIPLYAEVDGVFVNNASTYVANGTTYYNAIIKLKKVGINDDGSNKQINPIVKAAFQLGRMYLPGVMFPGSESSQSNHQIIKGMVTLLQDMRSLFSGINRALYNRNAARIFDPTRSVVKLYNPIGTKIGGGSRVKKIEISDEWNAMTGEPTSVYGQEYSYTIDKNGASASSGVASYEPLNGGDENSNRKPVEFTIKRVMAPNDEYFQEEPLGESFFPDALVGYSKVTVKNLDRTSLNVKKHATGRTEYEFYTAKDFPVIVEKTALQKQPIKPKLIRNLLNFGSTDKLYLSQGFSIKTNDMHGKPRSQKSFEEGGISPYAGVTYFYKVKAGTTNQLDNAVDVINAANVISNKTIGVTTDFVTDSRSAVNNMWGAGASVNVNSAACSFYVPLVFIWPSFSHEKKEFYSITTTKVINQYGLVDYALAFDNNSTVETKNLLYDEETGEVVLTSTNNNYNDPVYNLNYPAYWAYDKMGHAYGNQNLEISGAWYNNTTGVVSGSYFVPGDEVLVKDGVTYTKTWVAQDKATSTNYLINATGAKYTTGTPNTNLTLKIIRSGKRNLLQSSMANLTCLADPRVANKINVTDLTKVISASATEYSENWQMTFGDSKTYNNGFCYTYEDADYIKRCNAVCDVISAVFSRFTGSEYTNVSNPCIVSPNIINSIVCGNVNSATYVSMWKAPAFPAFQFSSDDVLCGYAFREDLTPQFATTAFKTFIETHNYFTSACYGSPGAAILLDFHRSKTSLTNAANYTANYDVLGIKFVSQKGENSGFYQIAMGNPNFPLGHPCYAPDPNSIYPGVGINICIPSIPNSANFRWKDVETVRDFERVDVCPNFYPGTLPPNAKIKFNCYDINGNLISPAYFCDYSDYNPVTILSTYYVPANTTIQCGKKQNDVVNPYLENIRGNWRPKNEYTYLTNLNNTNNARLDGYYTSFKPFYDQKTNSAWLAVNNSGRNWDYNSLKPFDNWVKNNENQLINQFGNLVQQKDALNRPSAQLYGYNHTLPIAVAANSSHNEIAFEGFEDRSYSPDECSQYLTNTTNGFVNHGGFKNPYYSQNPYYYNLTNAYSNLAHSGRYSLLVTQGALNSSNKMILTRKLADPLPTGGTDNIPYTLKAIDNVGLFGPFHSAATAKKFVVSAWVKELDPIQLAYQGYGQPIATSPQKSDYGNSAWINVFLSTNPNTSLMSGPIKKSPVINGWQKIEYEFSVPASQVAGTTISIELCNASTTRTYLFDDVRVHPFNASMKTMVYDPQTLRLMAEHDERNFTTFYEYDEEGILVRVNKETENGIYTLKETRNGLKK